MPSEVVWSASVFGLVLAVGLATIFVRGRWRGSALDKLILFGPLFYAAPLAAFGTEHFTLTAGIASIVPAWMPWPEFWTYLVGACFIAAALSIVTGVLARPSAGAVAATFFLFVAMMDAPAFVETPGDRFALALALRELSFCAGALAFATRHAILATVARYVIAITVLVYGFEQFLHGDHVPAIPLDLETPSYVIGHAVWTYFTAAVYAVAGAFLLVGVRPRVAASCVAGVVLFVVLVVYVPMLVTERASLQSFNFVADTLMYCGAVLLLAGQATLDRPRKSGAAS